MFHTVSLLYYSYIGHGRIIMCVYCFVFILLPVDYDISLLSIGHRKEIGGNSLTEIYPSIS